MDEHIEAYAQEMLKQGAEPSEIHSFLKSRGVEDNKILNIIRDAENNIKEFAFHPEAQTKINSTLYDVALLTLFLYSLLLQTIAAFITIHFTDYGFALSFAFGLAFGIISSQILYKTGANSMRIARLGALVFPLSLPFITLIPSLITNSAINFTISPGVNTNTAYAYASIALYYIAMNIPYTFFHTGMKKGDMSYIAKLMLAGAIIIGLISIMIEYAIGLIGSAV